MLKDGLVIRRRRFDFRRHCRETAACQHDANFLTFGIGKINSIFEQKLDGNQIQRTNVSQSAAQKYDNAETFEALLAQSCEISGSFNADKRAAFTTGVGP